MKVKIPAGLAKAETLSDRGVKLIFNTRELGSDTKEIFNLVHTEGWLVYSNNDDITEVDIPDEKADPMLGTKTQAQRLRGIIYRLWEKGGKNGDSEEFYRSRMEQIIEQLKERLDS